MSLLRASEAARLLGLSQRTVYALAGLGRAFGYRGQAGHQGGERQGNGSAHGTPPGTTGNLVIVRSAAGAGHGSLGG